ncbi:MAG: hypothetical protein ACSHWZ_07575 [Sulfitobacter sp.]
MRARVYHGAMIRRAFLILLVMLMLPWGVALRLSDQGIAVAQSWAAAAEHTAGTEAKSHHAQSPLRDCLRGLFTGSHCHHDVMVAPEMSGAPDTQRQRKFWINSVLARDGLSHAPPRNPPRRA